MFNYTHFLYNVIFWKHVKKDLKKFILLKDIFRIVATLNFYIKGKD